MSCGRASPAAGRAGTWSLDPFPPAVEKLLTAPAGMEPAHPSAPLLFMEGFPRRKSVPGMN